MRRAFDLIAVAAVAVVLLLPKASLQAKVALTGEKIELDKIAELEPRNDHRIALVRATAYAERLEAKACVDETARGLAACDAAGPAKCSQAVRIRFGVISSAMQVLVDKGIDPHIDPKRAREAVSGVLHSTKASDKHQ